MASRPMAAAAGRLCGHGQCARIRPWLAKRCRILPRRSSAAHHTVACPSPKRTRTGRSPPMACVSESRGRCGGGHGTTCGSATRPARPPFNLVPDLGPRYQNRLQQTDLWTTTSPCWKNTSSGSRKPVIPRLGCRSIRTQGLTRVCSSSRRRHSGPPTISISRRRRAPSCQRLQTLVTFDRRVDVTFESTFGLFVNAGYRSQDASELKPLGLNLVDRTRRKNPLCRWRLARNSCFD
jgi:hypothetical protein